MERVPVESKTLLSAGYDAAARKLELEFRNGDIYEYDDVPPSVHEWLLRARNKGQYVNRMITPNYTYRRLPEPGAEPPADLLRALHRSLEQLRKP